jgi:excisionase family DNA binding protein
MKQEPVANLECQYFRIARVAKVLDASRSQVYKWIYEGRLKAVRLDRRSLRVTHQDLLDFQQTLARR